MAKTAKREEKPVKYTVKLKGSPTQIVGEHTIYLAKETVVFRDGEATVSASLIPLLRPYIEELAE